MAAVAKNKTSTVAKKGAAKAVSKEATKPATRPPETPPAKATAKTPKPPAVAFPKKNQAPMAAEFAARLPVAVGKKLEAVRSFLLKQKAVTEDVYYYGPKAGWGLRYLAAGRPLCALFVHGDRPLSIVSLEPTAHDAVDWEGLSPVAQQARESAHGSPALLWLDLPLDTSGATDLRAILKAKLNALPPRT